MLCATQLILQPGFFLAIPESLIQAQDPNSRSVLNAVACDAVERMVRKGYGRVKMLIATLLEEEELSIKDCLKSDWLTRFKAYRKPLEATIESNFRNSDRITILSKPRSVPLLWSLLEKSFVHLFYKSQAFYLPVVLKIDSLVTSNSFD